MPTLASLFRRRWLPGHLFGAYSCSSSQAPAAVLARSGVDIEIAAGQRSPIALDDDVLSGGAAESPAELVVGDELLAFRDQVVDFSCAEADAGPIVIDELAKAAHIGSEHGFLHGHGFERLERRREIGDAVSLTWVGQHVGESVVARHL